MAQPALKHRPSAASEGEAPRESDAVLAEADLEAWRAEIDARLRRQDQVHADFQPVLDRARAEEEALTADLFG